jgi:hypothetical protein
VTLCAGRLPAFCGAASPSARMMLNPSLTSPFRRLVDFPEQSQARDRS